MIETHKERKTSDAAVVIVYAENTKRIVMVKSKKGAVGLPGGGVESYDKIGDGSNPVFNGNMAAIRELHEETGLQLQELKYISSETVKFTMNEDDFKIPCSKTIHAFFVSIPAEVHPLSYDIRENSAEWVSINNFVNIESMHKVINVTLIEKAKQKGFIQ